MSESTREVELTLHLDAPPEDVWRALTDAEEVARWFAPEAEVEPQVGGSVVWAWSDTVRWPSRIDTFDVGRHLRLVYDRYAHEGEAARPDGGPAPTLAMDFRLEGSGGATILRLVHSGFGRGEDWDYEYDGVRRGWDFELRALKHYLARHRGKARMAFWMMRKPDMTGEEMWTRMAGERGLGFGERLEGLGEGDSYSLKAATGDLLEGPLMRYLPGLDFAGIVHGLNDGLFRFGVEACGGPRLAACIWMSAWDLPTEQVQGWGDRWSALLDALYGPA